jgi:hypothetical protein
MVAAMLKQIVAVGVCIFVLMLVIKDGRVLRMTGLTGSCSIVQTYSDSSTLVECHSGKLDGLPDLSRRACTSGQITRKAEYWRCTAGFDISYASR